MKATVVELPELNIFSKASELSIPRIKVSDIDTNVAIQLFKKAPALDWEDTARQRLEKIVAMLFVKCSETTKIEILNELGYDKMYKEDR